MKKNLLLFALLVVSINVFSQGIVVTPHPTNNPAATTQLVTDVLLNNACLAQISNVTKSTGTDFGYSQGNGIGTFTNSNGAFPFAEGVLLTSGNAVAAQGPNTNTSSFSSPAWAGDADISAAIAINSKNATILEFDFIPATATFSVDYIFASEEYGAYQCESNDGFAMFLTNVTTGSPTQNVAVVPSTTLPISINSIKDEINNSACPSVNPEYFGAFYGGGNAATAPINYEGRTVLMNASATLIPGNTYHLKIVIADDGDTDGTDGEYDSAVFFPQGGFNLGQELLGLDLTLVNNTALCVGDTFTLDTGLQPNESLYTFAWTRNGGSIPGGAVITDNQPGVYQVTVSTNGTSCVVTQEIEVEYAPAIVANTPNDLFACEDGSGNYTYNLALNTPVVKQGLNPATVVSYHATQADAENNVSPLGNTYVGSTNETVWVRVKSHNSSCYDVQSFQLLTAPAPTATQPSNLISCENAEGSGEAAFNLTLQNGIILGSQPVNENTILYYTSMAAAQDGSAPIDMPSEYTGGSQTIYARVQRNFDTNCYTLTSFDLIVVPLPVLTTPANVQECNTYTLPALPEGNYYTQAGGTGTMLNAGDEITTSQTLYIYAVNTQGTTNCASEVSFDIEIITAATAPEDVSSCGSYTLPVLPAGQFYYNGSGGTGGEIAGGTEITTTQVIYFYIPAAASCTENNNFTVTITNPPVIADPADVNECSPYALPALPANQNYYTGPNGTGTQVAAGTVISTSQTLYIYAVDSNNADCTSEESFEIVINNVQVNDMADITRCGVYGLPALPAGQNYYTGPNGTGDLLPVSTLIFSTQTIYIYAESPNNPACNDQEDFLVTISPLPVLDYILPVTACTSYTLPDLPSYADYYTAVGGPGGSGTVIPQGTVITNSQTIYAYAIGPNGCARQRVFDVTIIDVNALAPADVEQCGSYTLPDLGIGDYYTGPGGTGTQLTPGANITSTQTIYVYVESNTTPVCIAEESFEVVINPNPILSFIPAVVACNSYTLPDTLPSYADYYTGPNGSGTMLPAGTVISSSQTIYVYAVSSAGCTRARSFNVTIIDGSLAPEDVEACGSYALPALPLGDYYTAPSGGGTQLSEGTLITSTQTIYTYIAVTQGVNCTNNDSFTVTISPAAEADDPEDVISCFDYELPPLTNGDYYTGVNGTGTMLNAGDVITTDTTLHVYYENTAIPDCFADNAFTITINDIDIADPADQLVCGGYVLPELTMGNYYMLSGGPDTPGQVQYEAGDLIDTDQTVYVYATTNTLPVCTDEESFTVTIKPAPAIDMPANVGSCGTYTLPALTVGEYYTGPGGTGTQLFAGQVISADTDLYVYAETGGNPNCAAEHMFSIFINPQAPVSSTVCDSYTLPELPVGNYYTGPAGSGFQLFAGDVITSTQDIYVYIEMDAVPNCTDNNFFTITVNQSPVLAPVPVLEPMCDSYELPEILVGNYYTQPDGEGTLLNAGDLITSTQTVYVYADTGTTPDCTAQDSFEVVINHTPIPDARSKVERCDQYVLDELIVGEYYLLSGGPDVAGQQQFFEGDVITETMIMYIYAESGTTPNCFAENSFEIEIFTITADNPENGAISVCDSYTLPALEVGDYYLLSGGPDTPGQVLYEAGDVITASQTLYVYAELGGRVNCNDENEFVITVFDTPTVDALPESESVCFQYVLPALNVGNYYTGPGGTGTMLNAGDVITSTQEIYIYEATGDDFVTCSNERSFVIAVNSVYVPEIEDFAVCENYVLPELAVGNYFTAPGGTGTQLPAGTVINTTSTIYIYAETNTVPVCTAESDFVVTVVNAPTFVQPDPITTCGIDDLGHGIFNLVPSVQLALNSQPNVTATVHETLIDADFNNSPIANLDAYSNIVANNQTVYIRLQSDIVSTCYTVVALDLIVNPRPQAATPEDYELCDNGTDDTDGIATFDLTTRNEEVLDGMDPALFTVTYYETLATAEAGIQPIATPGNYNSATATVYVRVTNNDTGCYDVVPLELIVNPLPVVNNPAPYTLCDINNPGDEVEEFDLTTQYEFIVDDQNGINITFHHSYADAQTGDNPELNITAYENAATVETLFVRVTTEATGCYRIVLLDVRVEPLPILYLDNIDEELTVGCDEDGDGIAVFDLQAMIDAMVNGGQNLAVTFHETALDAENNLNPIPNIANYQNAVPLLDHIYVRVENTLTGCINSEIYELELTVVPSPQVPDLGDITQCDDEDNNGQNGLAFFDLTQQNQTIIDALGPDMIIHYFTSEAFARNGAPRITTPANYYGSHEQEIWVRVENPDNGCFGVTSFQLFLNQPLLLTTPSMLTMCNSQLPNDSQETFDLTVKDEEILGPFGVGQGYTVEYFETEADRDNNNPIVDPTQYENTANAQTLFVLVTSEEGCRSYTTLTIKVLPLPTPNQQPDALVLCDDNNSPDGVEVFDLTDAEDDIRNNDNTTLISYYETQADAEEGSNPIADPSAYQSASGSVWVRVAANTGNPNDEVCYQVVELELIVNPLPALGDNGVIPANAYCEENTDGFHTFILNEHTPAILGDSVNPDDYTIRFYFDQAALDAGTALPNQYTNQVQSHQTILVWVRNDATGCTTTAPVDLYVEEAATANPTTQLFDECDYDGTNDGFYEFNLTLVEDDVLGGQSTTDYNVAYYESEDDAINEENPIANPTAYVNTIAEDQTIWIRVTNISTISRCYDLTTVALHVEIIPEPVIQGGIICVDYDTQEVLNPVVMDTGLDDTHSFVWYLNGEVIPGATESVYVAEETGSYTVEATNAAGCTSFPIDPVTVTQSGPASIIGAGYSVTGAFSDEQIITVHVTGYGDYEYQLENGPWQDSNVFTNVIPRRTPYTVHVRDKGACSEYTVDIPEVNVIDYPRYFTPNGDGYNDYWNIFGLSSQGGAEIYIFDRYGKLIKQISSQSEGWNGTYNGNPMPADDYWFTVTFVETTISIEPLKDPQGNIVKDPVTDEPIMVEVPLELTREFKAHFSLKR